MSDGGGESVGGVIWFWFFLETEVKTNHFLHLWFAGGTVSGEGFLDFVWRVFVDFEMILFGNEKDNAASLSYHDAGSDVFAEEELFNGDNVWFGRVEDLVKRIVEF